MQHAPSLPPIDSASQSAISSPLLDSLMDMTEQDIPLCAAPPKKERRADPLSLVRIVFSIVCLGVLVWCLIMIGSQVLDHLRAKELDSGIQGVFWGDQGIEPEYHEEQLLSSPNYAASQTITDFSELLKPPSFNEKVAQVKARLGALKAINNEIYGYIHIENTNIDYPMVQHKDNNHYLKYDFSGGSSSTGSIFVDYRNKKNLTANRNTVIYGHHMTTGSAMFKTLDYYYDEEFFLNNPDITIYTFDGIYRFRVFAVYRTDMSYHYIQTHFATDEDFVAFCEEMRSNSQIYREGITFDKDSRIITLSTCTNRTKAERTAVHAILVDVEE